MLRLPDDEQVFAAIQKVSMLSGEEIDRQINSRIGPSMFAGFAMVASKMIGDDPDDHTVAERVKLMVYAYLLCTEAFADVFAAADKKE
jgi:hypothetical protein